MGKKSRVWHDAFMLLSVLSTVPQAKADVKSDLGISYNLRLQEAINQLKAVGIFLDVSIDKVSGMCYYALPPVVMKHTRSIVVAYFKDTDNGVNIIDNDEYVKNLRDVCKIFGCV